MMSLEFDDTIAALASPPGPAARGILRISGNAAKSVLDNLIDPDQPTRWQNPRAAQRHTGRIRLPQLTVPLRAAVYYWPTSRSYTGQPLAEIHTIGSPPLLEAVLGELHRLGARPARPGEFTLRAFLAGRIDLMQAEAVLGVIDAHGQQELQTALEQLAGGISGRIGGVRSDLLDLLADLEAGLDFVEEDIEFVARSELIQRVAAARHSVESLLRQSETRMHTTARPRIALAGLPNAGKSTLFNALVGRDAALVSEIEGTTRDYLSANWDCHGLAVELIDTAGWDSTTDGIDQSAQVARGRQLEQADVVLWCSAADLDDELRQRDQTLRLDAEQRFPVVIPVITKLDRARHSTPERTGGSFVPVQVCALKGVGLNELADVVKRRLTAPASGWRQLLGTTASRCRDSLHSAAAALLNAEHAARDRFAGEELLAIELRDALEHLGKVVGAVYTDDILDRIFSRFCIGK